MQLAALTISLIIKGTELKLQSRESARYMYIVTSFDGLLVYCGIF